MIFAYSKDAACYRGLHPALDRALALLTPDFLANFGNETVYLEDKALYVMRNFFSTQPDEKTFYESHRRYLDIHVVLKGEERLDIADPALLTLDEARSKPENDFYAYTDKAPACVRVNCVPGTFLVAFPHDAHRCQGRVSGPSEVEKAVFKICID